jgi:hypothetical protein
MPEGIPFDLWKETIDHIDEPEKVGELGRRGYEAFYGSDVSSHAENLELLPVLAHLLDKAFATLDPDRLADMKQCIEGRGEFFETTFWEDAAIRGEAHSIMDREISAGNLPTLLELLVIAHDLEASIRPNLFRIAWIAKLSTGDRSIKYSEIQLNPYREQGSLGWALRLISDWLDAKAMEVLDTSEMETLRAFHDSMAGHEENQASLNEVRNAVAHRDFVIGPKTVVVGFHPAPGHRQPNDREQVTVWRRETLGLMSLVYGFRVMFLAHTAARCGDIRPAFLPQ